LDLQDRAIAAIQERHAMEFLGTGEHAGQKWAFVRQARIVEILTFLRDELGCDMLTDLTAVDCLNQGQPERFSIVYQLYSTKGNQYFRLKTWVSESDPEIDTASDVWKAAPWAEREVWDMFGIRFRGHRDLRRILLPFEYPGHPLRKDYPLIGHGERQDFPRYVK
jgi:NADH-quinone oxidoreductase subunit C